MASSNRAKQQSVSEGGRGGILRGVGPLAVFDTFHTMMIMGRARRKAESWRRTPLVLGAASLLLCGCASHPDKVALVEQQPIPPITMEWAPACDLQAAEPYFSVAILEDGTVDFVGGRQAREVGQRTGRIVPRDVAALHRLAVNAVTRSAPHRRLHEGDEGFEYCLQISLRSATNTAETRRFGSDTKKVRSLVDAVERVVSLRKWVCPARASSMGPELRLNRGYCGGWTHREAIGFSIREEGRCVYHSGETYPDVIHFTVSYTSAFTASPVLVQEGYRDIDKAQFTDLVQVMRESSLAQPQIEEPNPRKDLDYSGRSRADLLRFQGVLDRIVNFDLPPIAPEAVSCGEPDNPGGFYLRYEYGPPLNR